MRKLSILSFVTLDGVMQAPKLPDEDRSGGFSRGGWAAPHWDAVMTQVEREAMAVPYAPLFGRKTYQLFAASFAKLGDGHPLNRATKYVVTSTLTDLAWSNSVRIEGDLAVEVARLKEEEGPPLQVHGSVELIQSLFANDLVDELRLWIFPVLVGSGKRLFADGTPPLAIRHKRSETGPTGVVMAFYERIGDGMLSG